MPGKRRPSLSSVHTMVGAMAADLLIGVALAGADPSPRREDDGRTPVAEGGQVRPAASGDAVGTARRAFNVMTKPTGAVRNLDCEYCFYLSKEQLYPGSTFRMTPDLHETYLPQLFAAHGLSDEVVVAYQGGEPTLMGLEFFARSVEAAA